jgi:hypothetical protein
MPKQGKKKNSKYACTCVLFGFESVLTFRYS